MLLCQVSNKVGPVAQRLEQWTHNRGWSLSIFPMLLRNRTVAFNTRCLNCAVLLGFYWLSGTVHPTPVASGGLPQPPQCHPPIEILSAVFGTALRVPFYLSQHHSTRHAISEIGGSLL